MGVILDSSVLITAEPQGQNARQMLATLSNQVGHTEIAISVVTLIETGSWCGPVSLPAISATSS
jgi:hypothetical protein